MQNSPTTFEISDYFETAFYFCSTLVEYICKLRTYLIYVSRNSKRRVLKCNFHIISVFVYLVCLFYRWIHWQIETEIRIHTCIHTKAIPLLLLVWYRSLLSCAEENHTSIQVRANLVSAISLSYSAYAFKRIANRTSYVLAPVCVPSTSALRVCPTCIS